MFGTNGRKAMLSLLMLAAAGALRAQVSAYTFSSSVGTWTPIAGSGTPLGLAGLPDWLAIDDNAFITQGVDIPMGYGTTGNGWPIGFSFHYNGIAFDRVGLSTEGWLSLGRSQDGPYAVHIPIGNTAYTPLSSATATGIDLVRRHRIVGFANDLKAGGGVSAWPIQLRTYGAAPDRVFVAEWNVTRTGTAGGSFSFQVRLSEGGGDPAAQIVQVVYGGMSVSGSYAGQVGLGGMTPDDYNNRLVSISPYNWAASSPGTSNTSTCRIPTASTNLPSGLTFTWTPPACAVHGIQLSALSGGSGTITAELSWSPVQGATSYDYIITAGAPTSQVLVSGSGITGTQVSVSGIPAGQQLMVYVRADCATEGPGWGAGLPFSTQGVVGIQCGNAPAQFEHCYANNELRTWVFSSSTGDPLRLIFHEGTIAGGDQLVCYDGPNEQAPVLFTANGPVAGHIVNSTSGHLTMKIMADYLSSCGTGNMDPLQWEVGCLDCDPVLATFEVVDDCPAGQFSVRVMVIAPGTAVAPTITNDANGQSIPVIGMGPFMAGPFPIGAPVIVTVNNPQNAYCSHVSTEQINGNCPIVGCGPDTYTHCYVDGDAGQWTYTSGSSDRMGVRFRKGSLAAGDQLRLYDGPDIFSSAPLQSFNGVDLSGRLVTNTTSGNTILLEAAANGAQSCATQDAVQWEYVVACYDGCTQPAATYTVVDDCANGTFSVQVNVTGLGSGGSVLITNDGGVASVQASAIGQYAVGPFPQWVSVVVEVVGTSVLCTTNSPGLHSGCGVGMEEQTTGQLMIYPNPGSGTFRLTMPHGFGGRSELDVLDLSGRRVAGEVVRNPEGQGVLLDLDHLPVGSYVLVLRDERQVLTGRLVVVH